MKLVVFLFAALLISMNAQASPERCFLPNLVCHSEINAEPTQTSFQCGDGYAHWQDYTFYVDVWGHSSSYGLVVKKANQQVLNRTITCEVPESGWHYTFQADQDTVKISCYLNEQGGD